MHLYSVVSNERANKITRLIVSLTILLVLKENFHPSFLILYLLLRQKYLKEINESPLYTTDDTCNFSRRQLM